MTVATVDTDVVSRPHHHPAEVPMGASSKGWSPERPHVNGKYFLLDGGGPC